MKIELDHLKYHTFVQSSEGITLVSDEGTHPVYAGEVVDSAVIISGSIIHIVALIDRKTLVHWQGNEEFMSEEITKGENSLKGTKLVVDANNTVNLFYQQQNEKHSGYTLIHQYLHNGKWSEPLRVTTNISSDTNDWQVCCGFDQYLYLVYLDLERHVLYYRCTAIKKIIWSGAIPLIRERVYNIQMVANKQALFLIWLRELDDGKSIQALVKTNIWEKPVTLSVTGKDIFQPGFELDNHHIAVTWMQGGKLWTSNYEQQWSQPLQLELTERQFKLRTVRIEPDHGCAVIKIYMPKQVKQVSDQKSEQVAEKEETVEKKTDAGSLSGAQQQQKADLDPQIQARKEAEKRFFAEAFQLRREIQLLKTEEIKQIRNDIRDLKTAYHQTETDNSNELTRRVEQLEVAVTHCKSAIMRQRSLKKDVAQLQDTVMNIIKEITPQDEEQSFANDSIFHRIVTYFVRR